MAGEKTPGDVTRLLQRARKGDPGAADRLMHVVYDELKLVANRQLRFEKPGRTLDGTSLVHEAYLKLMEGKQVDGENRAHFFSLAARAMRQILVDRARRRKARKRGGDWKRMDLTSPDLILEAPPDELLALNEALDRLDALSPVERQVVEYKFFAGMTEAEIAGVLGISARTVGREWVKARAWLYNELYPDGK